MARTAMTRPKGGHQRQKRGQRRKATKKGGAARYRILFTSLTWEVPERESRLTEHVVPTADMPAGWEEMGSLLM